LAAGEIVGARIGEVTEAVAEEFRPLERERSGGRD
jgi:hypothetical protein